MSNDLRQPNRRRFLEIAGAAVPATLFVTGRSEAQQARSPTARDTEGPFYISNTPLVNNLNRFGKLGEPMHIIGRVMNASAPNDPIPGARLEIWQTDGTGTYYPESNGDYLDFADEEIDMRGTVITDQNGRFEVMSLFPQEYEPRPPHIHYWVHAHGFRSLVTQHYLDTSPHNRPNRTAQVDRSNPLAIYPAPTIYLAPT